MKTMNLKLWLLAIMLCVTVSASAEDFEVDGIYYNITSSTTPLTVRVLYKEDYLEYNAYTGSITIPQSVTYNGNTYSVTSIGSSAFQGCTGLTAITIPESVTSIGEGAFYGCTGLTTVTIPNSMTSIGSSAFQGCTGLTAITIPESVTNIGDWAFGDCNGLTSIIVENGNIVYDSRNNCNAIIETATNTLVVGCKKTSIPESVTSIGEGAFYGCTGLTAVTIPNSVTSIGQVAFYGCTGLTTVTIPESVTSIGYGAFHNTAWYNKQPRGVIYTGEVVYEYKWTMPENTEIVIKEGTHSITDRAFNHCTGLTSVVIPNSVTNIGDWAFGDCSGLTSITIPNSVTSIGNSAFQGCTGLTAITIPESVTSIGNYAFYGCTGLTAVTIPNSVTSIGHGAFDGCSGLTIRPVCVNKANVEKTIDKPIEETPRNNEMDSPNHGASSSPVAVDDINDETILDAPDEPAEFPGNLSTWLAQNIQYPPFCQEMGIQGNVLVQFVINKDGSICDIEVLKSPNEHFSKEAVRLMKAMPKWKPARKDNQPVRMRYVNRIRFRLS